MRPQHPGDLAIGHAGASVAPPSGAGDHPAAPLSSGGSVGGQSRHWEIHELGIRAAFPDGAQFLGSGRGPLGETGQDQQYLLSTA